MLILAACGSVTPTKDAEIGAIDESNELFNYEIVKLEIVDSIHATQENSGLFYKPSDPTKSFLDLVLKVQNKSTKEIEPDSLLKGTSIKFDKVETPATIYTEEKALSEVSQFGIIKPNEETFIHIAVEVDPNVVPEDVELSLKINEKETKMTLNREALKEKQVMLNKGEVLTLEDRYKLTYSDNYLSDTLESKFNTYYYDAADNSTFVIAEFSVENIGKSELDPDKIINSKVIVDDKYEYMGTAVSEAEDMRLGPFNRVTPMTSAVLYIKVEIPKSVEDKEIMMKINVAGETKYLKIQ